MCFSAEASFAGGVVISAIGVFTVKEIHKPSQIAFACIPLFFGVQQFTEGFLWLALPNHDSVKLQKICTYIFLIMADVLWPIMIPLSVLLMEENKRIKKALWVLLSAGFILGLYYVFCLLFYDITPQIKGYHIDYYTDFPSSLAVVAFAVYLVVTITPLFISSVKRTHLLGVLMSLSCAVTLIFFTQFLASVWCFFAALISGVIFWILRDAKKKFNIENLLLRK